MSSAATELTSVLVSGNIAHDTTLFLDGRLSRYAGLDRGSADMAFLARHVRRDFGGCAANISHGLRMLGLDPMPLAVVGDDFTHYRSHLEKAGVNLSRVVHRPGTATASSIILSDDEGAQLTAFHLGAASFSHELTVGDTSGIRLAVVAPTHRTAMLGHVRELAASATPTLFLPAQVITVFSGSELREMIDHVDYLVANQEEARVLCERTGLDRETVARQLRTLVVTHGASGSTVYAEGQFIRIPPVAAVAGVVDPTGCGDAYVAGFISGIVAGADWATAGRLGSVMAGINAAHWGTQRYQCDKDTLRERYAAAFGQPAGA